MRKLVVTHYENKILQATIHDGKVTDLNLSENNTVLGNIYVGKVANIVDCQDKESCRILRAYHQGRIFCSSYRKPDWNIRQDK